MNLANSDSIMLGGPVAATRLTTGMPLNMGNFSGMKTAMGVRPPTGGGSLPPGMRPPSQGGLRGTVAIPMAAVVPTNAEQSIAARPLTQQGMSGMRTARPSTGSSRTVADRSYFINELRTRITDITVEMEKMTTESVQLEEEKTIYAQLERRYEALMSTVRACEGELADFNLAMDKLRSHTRVNEVAEVAQRLASRNDTERQKADELFIQLSELERQNLEVEDSIQEKREAIRRTLEEFSPSAVEEFDQLEAELRALSVTQTEQESRLSQMTNILAEHEETRGSAAFETHQHGLALQKEHKQLMDKRTELEEELAVSVSPRQLQTRLASRLKQKSEEYAELEESKVQLEKEIDNLQEEMRELESSIAEKRPLAEKAGKYEALYERERKMNELIESHKIKMDSVLATHAELQRKVKVMRKQAEEEIVRNDVLRQIAEGNSGDARAELDALKEEIDFKAENVRSSETTIVMLERERVKRLEELKKFDGLEEKISNEIIELQEKIQKMSADLASVKTDEQLKEHHQQEKRRMLSLKAALKQESQVLNSSVKELHVSIQKQTHELQRLEEYKLTEAAESQYATSSARVEALQSFINSRQTAGTYTLTRAQCLQSAAQINQILISM